MPTKPSIDCHRCRHYFVTWEKRQPHGCKAMGFKSEQLPSIVVFHTSGEQCLRYEPKPHIKSGTQGVKK
ncbi:MAG: uracil-DNA glycosylase [Desulfobacteraceae bacterium]|nr:uracil-DNA glycosylase [Desulfobacteraceae bacterium]